MLAFVSNTRVCEIDSSSLGCQGWFCCFYNICKLNPDVGTASIVQELPDSAKERIEAVGDIRPIYPPKLSSRSTTF